MYGRDLAEIYDTLYIDGKGKDYRSEAAAIAELVRQRNPHATTLLDVACGTGNHLAVMRSYFAYVEGLELSDDMRQRAAAKLPGVPIHAGDMRNFSLKRRFDVVTCLFSSISHVAGMSELCDTVGMLCAHLNEGGVLILEPWFTDDRFRPMVSTVRCDSGGRAIVRMSHADRAGRGHSKVTMNYLTGDIGGIKFFSEEHVISLFSEDEYLGALRAAGMQDISVVAGHPWGQLVSTRPSVIN
jgi:SAM-dependent methyltransferase